MSRPDELSAMTIDELATTVEKAIAGSKALEEEARRAQEELALQLTEALKAWFARVKPAARILATAVDSGWSLDDRRGDQFDRYLGNLWRSA